ncbi:hypothetical protein ANME2D_01236 [Candidatus Methanoperedens nitroreducens]|uniref:Uncharacterized protein n=1 Tax=Candidatus Methanoperedens nitratireducens TaxID=1392998 RepID=A0A062V0Y1_9EURY|nr:hypothetical protein ANME2D_01236 [Candidatus Methanoperedens nitroreducens]
MKTYKIGKVRLTVGDKAGNTATANWNFTLDTTPPETTISNSSLASYFRLFRLSGSIHFAAVQLHLSC